MAKHIVRVIMEVEKVQDGDIVRHSGASLEYHGMSDEHLSFVQNTLHDMQQELVDKGMENALANAKDKTRAAQIIGEERIEAMAERKERRSKKRRSS